MSDDSYLLDSKDKKDKPASTWFGRILKIIFFISAFILVILTVLANMGGSNEMLRDGVGQSISKIFGGRPVVMKRLVHMGFFPTVALDIEGVSVFSKPEDIVPLVKLKKFQAYMPFWNVATNSPRVTKLYIEGFQAIKGVFLPEEILVDKVFIDHDMEAETSELKGNGKIGIHPWSFSVDLNVKGSKGKYSFMLSEVSKASFDIADIHFVGTFVHGKGNYFKFENFSIVYGDKNIGGDITLSALSEKLIKLKGTLRTGGDKTVLSPDLVMSISDSGKRDISGLVVSDKFMIEDLLGEDSVFTIFSRLQEIMGHGAIPRSKEGKAALLGRNNMNIDFNLNNVDMGGQIKSDLAFKVVQDDGNIKMGPVLSAGNMIIPAIMILYEQEEEQLISIIQDGRLDVSIIQSWLKNLPQRVLDQRYIDVVCGIAEFSEKNDHVKIDSFGINTKAHNISVKEKNIPHDMNFSDLHFIESNGSADLVKVELSKRLYDFVQGSFQKSKDGSPCASFVSLTKRVTVENIPDTQEKATQDIQQ